MRRPSFQFYPRDWSGDIGLRSCSPEARALWIDMMCLMNEGQPYGYLRTDSGDIPVQVVAHAAGMSRRETLRKLAELEQKNIFSRDEFGTIYCRRMVRDEALRVVRSENGHKSEKNGNVPRKKNVADVNHIKVDIHQDVRDDIPGGPPEGRYAVPSPSSSSSSSSSITTPSKEVVVITPAAKPPSWEEEFSTLIVEVATGIHARHPAVHRDCGVSHVSARLATICRKGTHQERVRALQAVAEGHSAWCGCGQWVNNSGQYAHGLENFLAPTKRRWESAPPDTLFDGHKPTRSEVEFAKAVDLLDALDEMKRKA